MAIYTAFHVQQKDILTAKHDFSSDTFKVALTNVQPDVANDEVLADITEIAETGGYAAGGYTLDNVVVTVTAGVAKVTIDDETILAAGGSVGPFRYLVVYNDTTVSPLKPLCFYYDYGDNLTLGDTEDVDTDFNQTNGVFTLA